MLRKIILAAIVLFGLCQIGFSQDFKKQFETAFDKNDAGEQLKVLVSWEKAKTNESELFVAYYNYYFNKSRTDGLRITPTESGSYIGSNSSFDPKLFKTALEYIDKGIEKFPNRLDMRFGKIYALGQNLQYEDFTAEIVKAVDYSNINKNQWLWEDDKPVENPQKFMLNAIQDYSVQLYDEGDEHLDKFKLIAETVLKYYPESVENLSNLSIVYLLKGDFEKALVSLLKAEKIAPKDTIVLNNIATCYAGMGDKTSAIRYYGLVIRYGDNEKSADAKRKIDELKKKK
jgi:tetratricopeptide (TPR) repeat protein